jgi:DNA replication and repair protein RecF
MFLKKLSLHSFRNYKKESFCFSPDVNFIHGKNAQGKTSLLEALYFLIIGRSFRTKFTKELIQFNSPYFAIGCEFEKNGLTHELRVICNGSKRQVLLNGSVCKSFLEVFGLIKGVVLYPEDYALISGSPSLRRRYLDLQIAQSSPLYLQHLSRYQKALKQRNAALKLRQENTLSIWEEALIEHGAHIILERKKACEKLSEIADSTLADITEKKEKLSLIYESLCKGTEISSLKENLETLFKQNRRKELLYGTTLVGPQKDDLDICINDKKAKIFASEGQQRTLAACLRLAEWQHLKNETQSLPIMIVDDMDISLDQERKEKLFERLDGCHQVFITSPYSPKKIFSSSRKTRLIEVNQGREIKRSHSVS